MQPLNNFNNKELYSPPAIHSTRGPYRHIIIHTVGPVINYRPRKISSHACSGFIARQFFSVEKYSYDAIIFDF